MNIAIKSYNLYAGQSSVSDYQLAYATILSVDRNGLGYDADATLTQTRGFKYTSSTGTLEFVVPAEGADDITFELINVIYRV